MFNIQQKQIWILIMLVKSYATFLPNADRYKDKFIVEKLWPWKDA